MVFVNTSIISDGPIKLKNHRVSCWEKCVSFKDIQVLRNGLTLIILCLFSYPLSTENNSIYLSLN